MYCFSNCYLEANRNIDVEATLFAVFFSEEKVDFNPAMQFINP